MFQHRSSALRGFRQAVYTGFSTVAVTVAAVCLLSVAACGEAPRLNAGDAVVDDFGDTLRLAAAPSRVVSLNPVTTELLFALGAGDRLVGRTSWDLYPEAARAVADVGNGMGPNVEVVLGQRPDLVLLYASESNRLAIQQLRAAGVQTLTHRTDRIADLQRVIPVIAAALGVDSVGRLVADSVHASVESVRALPRPAEPARAYWHIWDAPIMTIGGGSYLSELLEVAGAANVFGDLEQPSPQVSLEEIARRDPDVLLAGPLAAERIRRTPGWRAVRAVREGRIVVIDTTIVGRPGVRMGEAARFLRLHIVDSIGRPR
ncbi:MAG: ABC transporter substrate-binding protein [Gemmatimonadaceae bacterium]|nr:ABC transporter substrate-binding protein [Gemmatimonadaceae bacterium]